MSGKSGDSHEAAGVPLLDLKAQYASIRSEVDAAVRSVCESQYFILGPEVKGLEQETAAYCGSRHAVGVSSGTDALLAALMACGVGPGDEVLTTPYTFFATAGSIARLGAVPVFADIDAMSFNIDPNLVEASITPKTRAILPVHLYGQTADMDPILSLAGSRGIPVIEDAAQAIGTEYKGRRAGSIGRMGCFSFFPSKNLGGFGDGGLVTTGDDELAVRLQELRMHGSEKKYYHHMVGGNFRLDALQAAVLRVKLRYLDGWTAGRQQNAAIYNGLFADAGLLDPERAIISLPLESTVSGSGSPRSDELPAAGHRHIYNQYVIRCQRRDELRDHLQGLKIGCDIYYPVPLHLQECFSYLGGKPGQFPASELAAAQTLALPIFPELGRQRIETVVRAVADFYRNA
jgi:dTDP-4-amino-4,6-dideoxygalactose transaminase